MTVIELKKYIFENDKIPFILEEIGCHKIKYHDSSNTYSAAHKDGDNPQGVVINNDTYLSYHSYSRNEGFKNKLDLLSLIQQYEKLTFPKTIRYLHKILGLHYEFNKEKEDVKPKHIDYLNMGADLLLRYKYKSNVANIKYIEESEINTFVPYLHINWYREGIMPWTREKFGIMYSYKRNRVIIPLRYWSTGKLMGINSRTMIENYDELGIKKYWITPSYQKSMNLYGLYENYNSFNDGTAVALSGKTLSDEQIAILIGLNVEIVFALDNDVRPEEVLFLCDKFYQIRKVSFIYDKWELLDKKDAPMDKGNKVYKKLFDNRFEYTDGMHRQYVKWLNKK